MKKWIAVIAVAAVVLLGGGLWKALQDKKPAAASSAPASSAVSEAVSSSAASSAPASSEIPEKQALQDALAKGTGWGGDAGSSLKGAIAACALLDWAEDQQAANLQSLALANVITDWTHSLDADTLETFRTNWQYISDTADSIVKDPAAMSDLLDSAGNPNTHTSYTKANWDALKTAIDMALGSSLGS